MQNHSLILMLERYVFIFLNFITLPLAAQSVWNGAGGDNLWSTAANWDGNLPVQNSNIQFGGMTQLNSVHNLTPNINFNSITFNSGAGAFNLTGNSIYLSGNITNNSSSLQTVDLAMTLTWNRDLIGGAGGLLITRQISQTAPYWLNVGTGKTSLAGAGSLPDAATLYLSNTASILDISGISAAGDTVGAIYGEINSEIRLGSKTLTAGGGNRFDGRISGAGGSFIKVGNNELFLQDGGFSHTGTTFLNEGSIRLRRAYITGGSIQVASGTSLHGSGTIGGTIQIAAGGSLSNGGAGTFLNFAANTVITNDGSITPGGGNVSSGHTLLGNVTLQGSGVLIFTDHADNVLGGDSNNGAFTHGAGHTIQGSGQIGFNSLSIVNHGTIRSNGTAGIIIDPNASGFTNSSSGIVRATTGAPLNMQNGSFTNNGLIESAGALEFKSANVTNSGTIRSTAGSFKVTSSTIAGGTVELSGNSGLNLTSANLTGGTLTHGGSGMIESNGNPGVTNTISSALTLMASNTIQAGRALIITGGVTKSGVTTTFSGGETITISGTGISGAAAGSNVVSNASSLLLTAPSNYNGSTTISGGTFTVSGTGSLPDGTALSITASGASLNLSSITASSETIGSLAGVSGANVLLGGKNLTTGSDGTSTSFAGSISGAGASLTKQGAGVFTLSSANSYTGPTTIQAGTLNVTNTSGSATGTGSLSVSSGAALSGTGRVAPATNQFIYLNGALVVGDSTLGSPVASRLELATSGAGSTVMGISSTLAFDLFSRGGDLTTSTTAADYIRLFGSLNASSGGSMLLGNPNALTNFALGDKWRLFDLSSGSISHDFAIDATALNLASGLTGQFDRNTGIFSITAAIVPEPSRTAFFMVGLVTLICRRRRRANGVSL